MKKFIFYKMINGKKHTVLEVMSRKPKDEVRTKFNNLISFDGIDSVNM